MSINIELYQCSCESNVINKTNYLTSVGTLEGTFRTSVNLIAPEITFSSTTVPNFNYAYISAFSRYYYVDRITNLNNGMWQADLSVDVLMSYKSGILSCNAFVDRNEYTFNKLIVDNQVPMKQGETISVATVTNDVFTENSVGQYVLTGIGLTLSNASTESTTDDTPVVIEAVEETVTEEGETYVNDLELD